MADFIDLKVIDSLPLEEQIKIKKMIINQNELDLIPPGYLPDVVTSEYYFVSYSHRDYRLVYSDIFDLQQNGLSIWYDQGIAAGDNWKDTALKYITPFECKGVLFYISENALKSNAIKDEMEFAKSTNKPFIVILISPNGETLSELIERMYKEEAIEVERYNFYKEAFPEEVIYLPINFLIEAKVKKIKLSMPKQCVLDINVDASNFSSFNQITDEGLITEISGCKLVIRGLNDYYVTKISIKNYFDLLKASDLKKKQEEFAKKNPLVVKVIVPDNVEIKDIHIDPAAFANMKNLESVEIPRTFMPYIDKYAFYKCDKLKKVEFVECGGNWVYTIIRESAFEYCTSLESFDFKNVSIGKSAFANCRSLTSIDLSLVADGEIQDGAFYSCTSLVEVKFQNQLLKIGQAAFENTRLKVVNFPEDLEEIDKYAFNGCSYLEKIVFNKNLKIIGECAFANCRLLKNIRLPKSIEKIDERAFDWCDNLSNVYYPGTKAEFLKIIDKNWLGDHKQKITVYCEDDKIYYH